jgi:hypothetical protein
MQWLLCFACGLTKEQLEDVGNVNIDEGDDVHAI